MTAMTAMTAIPLYLPLLLSGLFAAAAPATRRLPPRAGTWLLSVGALLAALGSSASLALLAFQYLAREPGVAARARWSDAVLRAHEDLPPLVGPAAIVLIAVLAARITAVGRRRLIGTRQAYRLAAALPDTGADLAVLDDGEDGDTQACAVPGRPGRIVVSAGLLRSLDAQQRRAVLAHERSHLAHRHHLHATAAHLAAAANPLLWRIPAAVGLACERWADEDAAAASRRDTVADALTRVAVGSRPPISAVALPAAVTDVACRVVALRRPAPRLAMWRVALPTGVLIAIAATVALAMRDTENLFELAQRAYRAGQG